MIKKTTTLVSDPILLGLVMLATLVGMVVIFDAGYARSIQSGYGPIPREFRNQVILGVVALIAGVAAMRCSLESIRRFAALLFVITVGLLVLVLIPGIGIEMNGARRWLGFERFGVQPAELAKVACVVFLAATLAGRKTWKQPRQRSRNWGQWMDAIAVPKLVRGTPFFLVAIAAVLIEMEPDLGTAAIVLSTAFLMLIAAGVSWRSLVLLSLAGALMAGGLAMKEPYRLERILSHSSRWNEGHVDDMGFQTTQSETALAGGGLLGVGVGAGRAKHVMPAATTDFVLATMGEEFGLIGPLAVLALLGGIVFRLVQHSLTVPSAFARLCLLGVAAWIGVQTAVNVLMANGTLPPIGIPLPFISSGGSSLVALWTAIGICQAALRWRSKSEDVELEIGADRWRDRRPRVSRA